MIDDDRLEDVLASVGDLLVVVDGLAPASGPTRVRRRVVATACAALAAISTVLVVAPLRTAVADWLGLGSTRIEIRPPQATTAASLPSISSGLRAIDRATAERTVGEPLPALDSSMLGSPSGFAAMPEGGVLVVWPDATTLWIHVATSDTGVLLDKLVANADQVDRVDDLGDEAIAVSGDHVLQTPHRAIAAGNTVLWLDGSYELRLASDRPTGELIEIARQLAANG